MGQEELPHTLTQCAPRYRWLTQLPATRRTVLWELAKALEKSSPTLQEYMSSDNDDMKLSVKQLKDWGMHAAKNQGQTLQVRAKGRRGVGWGGWGGGRLGAITQGQARLGVPAPSPGSHPHHGQQ